LDLDDSIGHSILHGFCDELDGDDRFDALVGLYGMMNIILGYYPVWEPDPPQVSRVEGWIAYKISLRGNQCQLDRQRKRH
jgi:hypothetical protein